MKKSTEKKRKCKLQPATTELMVVALQPVDMGALRDHISNMVCANAEAMVEKIIAHVNGGNHQAMKYLFEMVGLFPATAMPDLPQEDSLAGMLLGRLGICDEDMAEAKHANHVK